MEIYATDKMLNITLFICEAFSENPGTYEQIEWMYKHKFKKYHKAIQNDFLTKSPIMTEGNLLREEYGKKAYALLLHLEEDDIFYGVLEIMKKNWPYAYTYTINRDSLELDHFAGSLREKYWGDKALSLREMNANIVIAITLSNFLNKPLEQTEFVVDYFKFLKERYDHNYRSLHEQEEELINLLGEKSKQKIVEQKMLLDSKCSKIRKISTLEEIPRAEIMAESIKVLFRSEGFKLSTLLDKIKLSEDDVDAAVLGYLIAKDEPDPQVNEYIYALCIKSLLRLYKDTKEYYFSNEKNNAYTDEKLLKEISILKYKNTSQNSKIKTLENEIKKLKEKTSR